MKVLPECDEYDLPPFMPAYLLAYHGHGEKHAPLPNLDLFVNRQLTLFCAILIALVTEVAWNNVSSLTLPMLLSSSNSSLCNK